jgi:osmotically-inducible protein OsmY
MKPMHAISWLSVVSVIGLFLGTAIFPSQSNAMALDKPGSHVKIFVQYKLIKSGLLKSNNIHVAVVDRKITLTGTVPTMYDISLAGEVARTVDRDYDVVNDLSVPGEIVPADLIEKQVMRRIETHDFYTVFDWVTVHVREGVVTRLDRITSNTERFVSYTAILSTGSTSLR